MENNIENNLKESKNIDVIKECILNKEYYTLKLFSNIFKIDSNLVKLVNDTDYPLNFKKIEELYEIQSSTRILLIPNWCSSKELCDIWNKMTKFQDYKWNNIQIVWEEPADFYCVINKPNNQGINYDPKRTIIFQMEPNMKTKPHFWGEFSDPDIGKFYYVGSHERVYNNVEWHISKTYKELMNESVDKNVELKNILSTVLSNKYEDPGQKLRIDFIKFLEYKEPELVHVFGQNKFKWKNYKGSLPYQSKDDALIPYKYTFNCENNSIHNYFTEKVVDGILSECLVFYSGCPNISEYIDERAFVYLELKDFESDYTLIKNAIEGDLWTERLPYIKEAKKKILNELQFFPRIERIINKI